MAPAFDGGDLYVTSLDTNSVVRFRGPLSATSDPELPELPVAVHKQTVFSATDTPKVLRSRKTTKSTVTIADSMEIHDLNVWLDISHDRPTDLDVFLVGPDGMTPDGTTRVELFAAKPADLQGITFDDEADVPIEAANLPSRSVYRPAESLGTFDAVDAQGDWTLEVRDRVASVNGTLHGWSLVLASTMTAPTQPSLSISDASIVEGDEETRDIIFTVQRFGDPLPEVSVDFETADDTATLGVDYMEASGRLTIPGGERTGEIRVTVNGDTTKEDDETFFVRLKDAPSGVTIDEATGTILNDDKKGRKPKASSTTDLSESATVSDETSSLADATDAALMELGLSSLEDNDDDSTQDITQKGLIDYLLYDL